MAEEAIPSAADRQRSRIPSTRLPSLAQLYAAQQLGQSLQANSATLPELYALEQTGAPLDLAPSPDPNSPQQSQPPTPQNQPLPILVDQSGAPLQPEPLTPGERLAGTARAAAQGLTGGLSDFGEAGARTLLGWQPQSIQARRSADEAFREGKPGKVQSQEGATFGDHLADIQAASQRFADDYPAEEAKAQGIGVVAPALLGLGAAGLLARMLSGERLAGTAAARTAPQVVAPLARRLGPKLAEEAAPKAASVATQAEPATTHILAGAEPAATTTAVPEAEAVPEAIARPPATPDGRYYSVLREVKLQPKPQGTGRRGHNRESNEIVLKDMESVPEEAQLMKDLGVELQRTPTGLAPDEPPPDHTWHHFPWEEGTMHLMPRSQHQAKEFQKVLHPFKYGGGGYARWGDKYLHIPGAATGGIWLMQRPDDEPDASAQQQDYD
jgi:hypothetical protein